MQSDAPKNAAAAAAATNAYGSTSGSASGSVYGRASGSAYGGAAARCGNGGAADDGGDDDDDPVYDAFSGELPLAEARRAAAQPSFEQQLAERRARLAQRRDAPPAAQRLDAPQRRRGGVRSYHETLELRERLDREAAADEDLAETEAALQTAFIEFLDMEKVFKSFTTLYRAATVNKSALSARRRRSAGPGHVLQQPLLPLA